MNGEPDQVRAMVARLIPDLIAVKPALRAEDIGPGSSLTEDLGFGSLELAALASRIRDKYPAFDLRRWLTGAIQPELDSVVMLAALLTEVTTTPEIPHA